MPLPIFGVGLMADMVQFFPQILFGAVTYYEFNGNVTYDIVVTSSTFALFALVGVNVAQTSEDVLLGTDTDFGLNLGGGIRFDIGSFRPVAGARVELGGGDAVVIFASLPFKLGN